MEVKPLQLTLISEETRSRYGYDSYTRKAYELKQLKKTEVFQYLECLYDEVVVKSLLNVLEREYVTIEMVHFPAEKYGIIKKTKKRNFCMRLFLYEMSNVFDDEHCWDGELVVYFGISSHPYEREWQDSHW